MRLRDPGARHSFGLDSPGILAQPRACISLGVNNGEWAQPAGPHCVCPCAEHRHTLHIDTPGSEPQATFQAVWVGMSCGHLSKAPQGHGAGDPAGSLHPVKGGGASKSLSFNLLQSSPAGGLCMPPPAPGTEGCQPQLAWVLHLPCWVLGSVLLSQGPASQGRVLGATNMDKKSTSTVPAYSRHSTDASQSGAQELTIHAPTGSLRVQPLGPTGFSRCF